MQENNQDTATQGVVVPQEAIAKSDAIKKGKKKTLAQLPVYRTTANIKYVVTMLLAKSPKKLTKFFDQMLGTISEAKKTIGMADISRSKEDRAWYLDCARVLMQDVYDDFTILHKLEIPGCEAKDGKTRNIPVISKDTANKAKALVKSVIAQLVAWRDYTSNEGAKSE